MKCLVCGSEMTNTVGGCFVCEECGLSVDDLVFRFPNYKSKEKAISNIDYLKDFLENNLKDE